MPRTIVLRAAVTAVALFGAVAYAADRELETVIVTAQKHPEPLQDVPAAVSALTGATLQAMGAETFTDYARSIPGLTFTDVGAGRQTVNLRGITPLGGAATVAYYIGDTPIPENIGALNPALIDIDRIEVLRGPQGTLYGSSSIGGTIKLVPRAPNLSQVEGSVKGEALVTQGADGASPGGETEFVLNLPVIHDLAAVRGAFWYRNAGGFIDRTYGYVGGVPPPQGKVANIPDEHTWGFRTTALLQPNEQFNLSAMIYQQRQHFDGNTDITAGASNPNERLVQNFIADVPEPQDNRFELYNLTAKYDIAGLNLVSSTSYSHTTVSISGEGTSAVQLFPSFVGLPGLATAVPNLSHNTKSNYNFTQEARVATSEQIAGFDAVIGIFYSKYKAPGFFVWSAPQYNALVAGNDPANPLYAPDDNIYGNEDTFRERQTAEFGELTYHFSNSLSVIAGLRHYDVSNSHYVSQNGWFVGGNVPGVTQITDLSSSAKGFVYKGTISYKLSSNHLLYAQYAEGFRPGYGNNPLPPQCDAQYSLEVKPDSIRSYEFGAKTDWLDKRLTANAAAYRVNWTNLQQAIGLPCGFSSGANFGSAVVRGIELEANAQLTRRVKVGLTATHIHTELEQDLPLQGALEGDPLLGVPNWLYSLYAQTTFPLLAVDDGFARLDYQYTGSSIGDYYRLSDGSRDSTYDQHIVRLWNLRTGMHYQSWEFSLSGTNLFNKTFRQSVDFIGAATTISIPGRPRYVINRPRTFSLSAVYQF